MNIDFPPEPTREPIRDRAATADDCAAGRAAFAAQAPAPELANTPFDVFLPRVASLSQQNGECATVVVIQAEMARLPENLVLLGYEDAQGALGVCTSSEINPWPCCFVFFQDPTIDLESVLREHPKSYVRRGATLATKPFRDDDPILFIRHEAGPHVQCFAAKIAQGSEHEAALQDCHACFVVCFADLDKTLDEINTLIDVQSTLQELTGGYLYLEWNDNLSAPE